MTEHQVVWGVQLLVMLGVAAGMVLILWRAIQWAVAHDGRPEHAVVIASVALVVGLGNIVTTYATLVFWPEMRDMGGTLVRGALGVGVIYMLAWGPWSPRERP